MWPWSPALQPPLRGTPVVPGVAFGPASLVRTEVSPAAIARFDGTTYADADAALAAYDVAAQAVADGFARKAEAASGAAAQVLTASAGLARDKGLRSAVRKHLRSERRRARRRTCGRRAVRHDLHRHGRPDGRAGDRPPGHRAAGRSPSWSASRSPGVGVPEEPCVLVAEDLAPADTAGLDPRLVLALVTERGGPTSHTAIIARQLGIPCVVGVAGAMTVAGRHARCWSTASPASSRPTRTRRLRPSGCPPTLLPGPRWRPGPARAPRPTGCR